MHLQSQGEVVSYSACCCMQYTVPLAKHLSERLMKFTELLTYLDTTFLYEYLEFKSPHWMAFFGQMWKISTRKSDW